MLNLATAPASVTAWTSPQWDGSQGEATPQNPNNGYPYQCATVEPFYIQAAAWSPDDWHGLHRDDGLPPERLAYW